MSKLGACLCGKLRYRIDGELLLTAICHCLNCQKQSGSAFSLVVLAAADSITFDGEMKTYADLGDSGQPVDRGFCPHCGSPVMSRMHSQPGVLAIKAGTLDDVESLNPVLQVWTEHWQPWVTKLNPGMPEFARNYIP